MGSLLAGVGGVAGEKRPVSLQIRDLQGWDPDLIFPTGEPSLGFSQAVWGLVGCTNRSRGCGSGEGKAHSQRRVGTAVQSQANERVPVGMAPGTWEVITREQAAFLARA